VCDLKLSHQIQIGKAVLEDKTLADLVISVADLKSLDAWELTGKELLRRLRSRDYWVIVPDKQLEVFREKTPSQIQVIPESLFTSEFSSKLDDAKGKVLPERRGWYLQQLIKLAAINRAKKLDRVIIWDADTVPLNDIRLFDIHGTCQYYRGYDYHLPYFENIDRLLGIDKAHKESFIAQCFPITGGQIQLFFEFLEERHSKPWWEAIIESIDFDESSGFSEYEVLGTFVSNHAEQAVHWQSGVWSLYGVAKHLAKQISRNRVASSTYDFMAIEGWAQPKWRYVEIDDFFKRLRGFVGSIFGKLRARINEKLRTPKSIIEALAGILGANENLQILQIGANDGIQSDPLRPFLKEPGSYSAKLVEPIKYYVDKLLELYENRADIQVLNLAVGEANGNLELFHIRPSIAYKMNGDGPSNNWALGQGSSSRATVVYWIYKNAWRGEAYTQEIPMYISAIEKISVPMTQTREFVDLPDQTLLVVDVQGMELEIIRGLDPASLPRWIVLEEDLGRSAATDLLVGWGYTALRIGSNILFSRVKT
jgi:FkbM family methyltransferase